MAADESGQEPTSARDSRLTSLDERLKHAEQVEDQRHPAVADPRTAARSNAARAIQSMVGMPLGGAIIGWTLDHFIGTAPWIMLVLMFIGFAGGVIDVLRFANKSPDGPAEK